MRGATSNGGDTVSTNEFQPTRPLRGATDVGGVDTSDGLNFNPRAPCGARPQLFHSLPPHSVFQPTRPLRGATNRTSAFGDNVKKDFNPRAPCGARHNFGLSCKTRNRFQPTRPLRGATPIMQSIGYMLPISTHAPLAGRDDWSYLVICLYSDFNPRAPCGARRGPYRRRETMPPISTHAPLAGRDSFWLNKVPAPSISTHAPLAGRDRSR